MGTERRTCQNCKQEFQIEPADFAFYQKMDVPPPTFCPECRLQSRLCFMWERSMHKRTCGMCGKSVVSNFPADKPITTYCSPCWWSDKWDGLDYGREYDPNRPFLEQLRELVMGTPFLALQQDYTTIINSDYTCFVGNAKNCYLVTIADYCENTMYSHIIANVKDSADCTMLGESELCYGCINVGRSHRAFFCEDSNELRDCWFMKDCVGCSDCFGCMGLRKKRYCIFNQQYSQEEYDKQLSGFHLDSVAGIKSAKDQAYVFWLTRPHKFIHDRLNNKITGDYVYTSKNSLNCYQVRSVEDSRFCSFLTLGPTKDAYDYTEWGNNASRIYQCAAVGEFVSDIKFCVDVWGHCQNIEYSMTCGASSNLFGCSKLRKKEYCILNKQYSKEEFHRLKKQIIEDMDKIPYRDSLGQEYKYGHFLPVSFSPADYNLTDANDFSPLTREAAISQGYQWKDAGQNPYPATLALDNIPDSIGNVSDSIIKEVLECPNCQWAYRIIAAELELLRKFNLPIPRECPNCRYKIRLARINPPRLYTRQCAKCSAAIQTSYAPERPEIIYCEACYQAEVI